MDVATDLDAWLSLARTLAQQPGAPEALARLITARDLPQVPATLPPEDLVSRPAPLPPAAWHARRLQQLAAPDADPLARRYHARWLWHLLAPEDPEGWPLVSVIIPAYNRAELLVEAVESVLANSYPRVEICVCDDASAVDPLPLLAPLGLGPRLRYHRRAVNGGVGAARQDALLLASGELVQLLDADDRLVAGGLTAKVAALAAVPDAELCFTPLAVTGSPPERWLRPPRELGGPACPTQEGPRAMVRSLVFLPTAVMVARHRLLAVGFDATLRLHEDRLAFARLGLRGVKAVALRRKTAERRYSPQSVTGSAPDMTRQRAYVHLLLLDEILDRPDYWPVAGHIMHGLFDPTLGNLEQRRSAAVDAQFEAYLARLADLVRTPPQGLSARPLLAMLLDAVAGYRAELGGGDLAATTLQRLQALLAESGEAGPDDLALWRTAINPGPIAPALRTIFAAQSRALRRGRAWVPLAALDQRPFRSVPHPAKRRWKLLASVARALGEAPARALARLLG